MIYYKINDDKYVNFQYINNIKNTMNKIMIFFTNQLNEKFSFNYKIVIINLLFKVFFLIFYLYPKF